MILKKMSSISTFAALNMKPELPLPNIWMSNQLSYVSDIINTIPERQGCMSNEWIHV